MELRACYFCGSPGAGLDTYPVVPERVAADGDPERVVLCPDCHAKLERVLDGVLGALDADSTDAGSGGPPAEAVGGLSAEITFEDGATDADGSDAPDPGPVADDPGDETPDPDVDVVPDASSGASPANAADAGTDGAGEDDGADVDGGATGEDDDGESSGSLRGLGNSGTTQYRQALRLLQNREFPMPRSDLVDVMSSAYDLTVDECERLVDFAVDRGWLVDDDGVLRRD